MSDSDLPLYAPGEIDVDAPRACVRMCEGARKIPWRTQDLVAMVTGR